MATTQTTLTTFETPVPLDRDTFMRRLIAGLGHLNEGILGSDVAGAYIMNVGLSMGAAIEDEYRRFWGIERPFTLDEYSHVIVDLKQKIGGNFSLVSADPDKVVVQTTSCPFDDFVRQSPSLCFMTSSVFGGIAARNFGYAKVVLHRRIALGDPGCYVTVHLRRTPEAQAAIGREYYPDVDRASTDIVEQLRLMDSVHRLRQQLGETSARWGEVVRAAAEAICAADVGGIVTYANARWRDLLGVEGDELVGHECLQLVHPDDLPAAEETLARVLQGERATGTECRLRHRDGSWRSVNVSAGPLRNEDGQIVGALGIFRDVTREREAQRLKDEFISAASHELRTPVTTIRALADLLLRHLDAGGGIPPEQLSRRLQTIRREADRLALLSTDLLDVVRLQTGKLKLRRERRDVCDLVAGCVGQQREMLEPAGRHRLVFHAPPSALPAEIDSLRLEQVISNLLDNAVKYSPDGGEVAVAVAARGTCALVSVSDQGIGIPEDDLPRLCSPFYRGSNASSTNFDGLGLGLYLCKAIVEGHGGTLTAQSRLGQGTTFVVCLPLAQE